MADPPFILGYAGTQTDASVGPDRFVFEPPAFATSLVLNSLGACLLTGLAVVLTRHVVTFLGGLENAHPVVVVATFLFTCAAFGLPHAQRVMHLLRFGGQPITITIADGQLILSDPPLWGLKVESILLYDVTRLDTGLGGWTLLGPSICRLRIRRRDDVPLDVHVRASEAVALDAAVAAIRTHLPHRPHQQ